MAKKILTTSVLLRLKDKTPTPIAPPPDIQSSQTQLWLGFSVLLVLGLLVLSIVTGAAGDWLKTLKLWTGTPATPMSVITLNVQRTASYAGLAYTVINAQYATSFSDDNIQAGVAIVRLNMQVANRSSDAISVIYYDIARLLAPKLAPIIPTNVYLSNGPKPGTSEMGWIDFSVPAELQLSTLQLQLGSAPFGETLVTIPFTGKFDGNRYKDRSVPQSLDINYYFPHNAPEMLVYHLLDVDVRYAYKGTQVKAGQQYYVLNFRVDNPNADKVSPGFGFDYIRISFNGGPIQPPIDNTLPYGFDARAKGVSGRVVFIGPIGLTSLTLDFLVQYGSGGSEYQVSL
jgi:hypothetical protein